MVKTPEAWRGTLAGTPVRSRRFVAWPLRESCASDLATRRASRVSPPKDERPDSGGAPACCREFFGGRSSYPALKEASLKFAPPVNESVARQDGLKTFGLQRAGLDEL